MKKILSFLLIFIVLFSISGSVLSQTANYPVVQTGNASLINTNDATLNGQVNPNGYPSIVYFEYGQTMSLGQVTPSQSISTGYSNINISSMISGLSPGITYYYRIDAINSYGIARGSIISFTTQGLGQNLYNVVSVATNAATDIYGTNATLHAYASVNGIQGLGWFEYGINPSNLNLQTTPVVINTLDYYRTNNQNPFYSYQLTNLNPNTTYYFRAALQNGEFISYGQQLHFITGSTPLSYADNNIYSQINPTPYSYNNYDYNPNPAVNYVYESPKVVYINPDGTPYIPQTSPSSNIPGNGSTYQQGNYYYAPYYGMVSNIPSSQYSASALGAAGGFTSASLFGALLVIVLASLLAVGFSRKSF